MTRVEIKRNVLEDNNRAAAELRKIFAEHGVVVLNMVSSPGAGKTTLLEKTIAGVQDRCKLGLIAGDVQTENDADRLRNAGAATVRSIVTGGACHLDARMVAKAVDGLPLDDIDVLFIENVGNLVCPSSYDLGEDMKVVLVSVTEGDDKPLKYPGMFRRSSIMLVTKTDLLPHCDFDLSAVKANALRINGDLEHLQLCCKTGEGLATWFDKLTDLVSAKRKK